jgi:hypothetical protein
LPVRPNADLLDVGLLVDQGDQHIAQRSILVVDGDPAPPGGGVPGQDDEGGRLGVGHVVQAHLAEPLTGRPFNLA